MKTWLPAQTDLEHGAPSVRDAMARNCIFDARRTICITRVRVEPMSFDTVHAISVCHHGRGHARGHARVLRQAGEYPGLEMVGHGLSARRGLGGDLDHRRLETRRHAVAGAECGGLHCLRHGLECRARVPRPQAQSAGAGVRRDRLDRRRRGVAVVESRHAPDRRCGDRRRLCGADGFRIVERAAADHAEALADDCGAGHARLRADAADPARRPPASA